jgi:two-component system copper resistance phosphate regulon response regulator CusR
LTYYLSSHGYEVSSALDGNRALELGETGDYALAILDVHMPTYDGVEVLQMLRRRHVLHPLKIIALTGDTSDATRDALVEGGVDEVMTKPVDLKKLLAAVIALTG